MWGWVWCGQWGVGGVGMVRGGVEVGAHTHTKHLPAGDSSRLTRVLIEFFIWPTNCVEYGARARACACVRACSRVRVFVCVCVRVRARARVRVRVYVCV